MNGLNDLYNRKSLEDIILDNYIRLWDAIKNHNNLRVNPTVPRKEYVKKIHRYRKKCIRCGVEYDTKNNQKKLCGSKLTHTGCAWLSTIEGIRKARLMRKLSKT